jgi:hypothetical protein
VFICVHLWLRKINLEEQEERLIEVAKWRKGNSRFSKLKGEKRKLRLFLALVFGLLCALLWHFLHLTGEVYQPSLTDPHFWLHLLIEGVVAIYGAALFYLIWKLF